MKDLTDDQIDRALDRFDPRFLVPMRRHQKIGFLLGLAKPNFYFQYDMGAGKTSLSLELMRYLRQQNLVRKIIVCMPTNELIDGWVEEIEKWALDLPYLALKGSSDEKWINFEKFDDGLVLVSYPALVWMTCDRRTRKNQTKLVPIPELVSKFVAGADAAIWDEITRTANEKSLTFRVCNQLSNRAYYRYGLAGRMFGRDPQAVWAQMYLIDRGDSFSYNINFFRDVFFHKRKSFFGGPFSFDYKFNKERDDDFNRLMSNSSIRFSAEECIDLPDVTRIKKFVQLPASMALFYQKALATLKEAKGDYDECRNAFIRLRQISSGFLGFKDDETGERAQIAFPENPKLDLLIDLIESMPEGHKALVGVDFIWSGAAISARLDKEKIKHGWLHGGTKDWTSMKKKFDHDPKFRVLIVQSRKGSYGLNLQAASYLLIYESPVGVLDRRQLEARINRQGQKNKVFIYDLICKGTADESILGFHNEGNNLYKSLVVNPELVLKDV